MKKNPRIAGATGVRGTTSRGTYPDSKPNIYTKNSKTNNRYSVIDEEDDGEVVVDVEQPKAVTITPTTTTTVNSPTDANATVVDEPGWTVNKKKIREKRPKTRTNRRNRDDDDELHGEMIVDNVDHKLDPNDIGKEYKFNCKWIVWSHLIDSTDWTPESYVLTYTIVTISDFWHFFNNTSKLDFDKYQFYVMREGTQPQWEHISNRNGGTCSLRVSKHKASELIEQLAIMVLNESFSDTPSDINGLSFGSKQNWCIVKIWNNDRQNDTSDHVPVYITKRYSTQPRYKRNEPEYKM